MQVYIRNPNSTPYCKTILPLRIQTNDKRIKMRSVFHKNKLNLKGKINTTTFTHSILQKNEKITLKNPYKNKIKNKKP